MDSLKLVSELFNSLLSPIIAITVTYIAYQQWKTNKEKSNREKNAAIIGIYLRVKEFFNFIDYKNKVDKDLFKSFQKAAAEADFICEQKLIDWLRDVESDASVWLDLDRIVQDASMHKRPDVVNKDLDYMSDSIEKLLDASGDLLEMFKEQINLNKK